MSPNTCGVFSFTFAAEFTLHSICLLHCIPSSQLLNQSGELPQIRHAEERPLLANDKLRVRCHEIRPLRWNRADGRLIDVQYEPSAIPVVPFAHARELLAAEGMEWVRDAH